MAQKFLMIALLTSTILADVAVMSWSLQVQVHSSV